MSTHFNKEIDYITGKKKMRIILLWSKISSVPYHVLLMRSNRNFIDEYKWDSILGIWKSIKLMYPQPYSCILYGINSDVPLKEILEFCSNEMKDFKTINCSSSLSEIIKKNEYTTIWLVCNEDPIKMWSRLKVKELKKIICFMDLSDYEKDYKILSK